MRVAALRVTLNFFLYSKALSSSRYGLGVTIGHPLAPLFSRLHHQCVAGGPGGWLYPYYLGSRALLQSSTP